MDRLNRYSRLSRASNNEPEEEYVKSHYEILQEAQETSHKYESVFKNTFAVLIGLVIALLMI